jgi:hypothetical protein
MNATNARMELVQGLGNLEAMILDGIAFKSTLS